MFNVRVYGVLTDKARGVLVSDEYIRGGYYTKFPGGGLEKGEGTRDCLKREFMEEMDLKIEVLEHIYTTDYYQESAFKKGDQIISIYYYVQPLEEIQFLLTEKEFDFTEQQLEIYNQASEIETFRFVPFRDFHRDLFTLPIDKIVGEMVKQDFVV